MKILDAWPDSLRADKYRNLDGYLDERVYQFDKADAITELRAEWERESWNKAHPIEDANEDMLLRRLRGRLAFVSARKGGAYMYKTKIKDGYLYFVYGPRTCGGKAWCTELSIVNTGRCGDHQS